MINVKKFVDRVSAQESKGARDVVLSISEARMLKDEIVKLLADKLVEAEILANMPVTVEVKGGKW